jgi:hypothetical protein
MPEPGERKQDGLYDKLIPLAFILLGLIMVSLVIFSIGVLAGWFHWN